MYRYSLCHSMLEGQFLYSLLLHMLCWLYAISWNTAEYQWGHWTSPLKVIFEVRLGEKSVLEVNYTRKLYAMKYGAQTLFYIVYKQISYIKIVYVFYLVSVGIFSSKQNISLAQNNALSKTAHLAEIMIQGFHIYWSQSITVECLKSN